MKDLDELIAERLGERQRKIDFLRQRELQEAMPQKKLWRGKWWVTASAVAAVAVIALVVLPLFRQPSIAGLEMTVPDFDTYRGISTNKIERLINKGHYDEALTLTDKAILESKKRVDELDYGELQDDETDYEIELELDRGCELLWTRIYLLVRLNRQQDALNDLDVYISSQGPHREEAVALRKRIQNI